MLRQKEDGNPMRILLALCAIPLVAASALAAELPEWQTEGNCVALAGGAQNNDQLVYDACMTEEERSKDILSKKYADLPIEVIKHCEKRSSVAAPSYSTLRACIEARLDRD